MRIHSTYERMRSEDFIEAATDESHEVLKGAVGLTKFLEGIDELTRSQQIDIVQQAIILIEQLYVHLPLKRAMHGIDPLQKLKLLHRRLPQLPNEMSFHHEMISIFTSLRDLHTVYILPEYLAKGISILPFRLERCLLPEGLTGYVASDVFFRHETFVKGVRLVYWNGVPIDRAVENAAAKHAGSNLEARRARGLDSLTVCPMNTSAPPDEEWVTVTYVDGNDATHELRMDWTVVGLPSMAEAQVPIHNPAASAYAFDLQGETIRRVHEMLYAQSNVQNVSPEINAVSIETTMRGVFKVQKILTDNKAFGYIRIFTFSVPNRPDASFPDEPYVNEFLRLIEDSEMPKSGLILDVRNNPGGLIWAGERLLQLLTPRTVEPCRFQFINTESTYMLCKRNPDYAKWLPSVERALETGATFSAAFPVTPAKRCNDIGQRYYGPVVLITDGKSYSTTDIFAAGFKDHRIGKILGADGNTGAGGANVWSVSEIEQFFTGPGMVSPLHQLPNGANLRVAIRRAIRVGPEAGTEIEDLGVRPDESHVMTLRDVTAGNVDIIAHAASIIAAEKVYTFKVGAVRNGRTVIMDITTENVDYINTYVDGHPQGWYNVRNGVLHLELDLSAAAKVDLQGYAGECLVCRRVVSA